MRRTARLLFPAIPAALAVGAAGLAFWSAQRTLNRSAGLARTQHQLHFSLRPYDPSAAQAVNPGFEPVSSAAGFTAGAFFGERSDLYIAGPSGLSLYAVDGTLKQSLRTGFELPVSIISAVTPGRLRGATEPEVLVATAGDGLLVLDGRVKGAPAIRQLLPDSVDARDLTSLLPLASGDLLLGTRHGGLLLFNGTTLEPFGKPTEAREITALAAVDAASFLIGTRNAGVFYVHAGTVAHADAAAGLPDDQVEAIAVRAGKAFVGTPLGVAEFNLLQTDAAFRPERVLAPGLFSHALAVDGNAELLVGSLDEGIRPVSLQVRPRLRNAALPIGMGFAESSTKAQRIDQFLAPAGNSSELYAIADGALLRRSGSAWSEALPRPADSLADRNIAALAFAPDGSLFVGFFDHGLDIVSATGTLRHLEDDHLFCVNRLMVDPVRQTMTAATANGLVLFDRQGAARQVLTRRDGLISDHITDVAFTRTGMTLATPAGLTFLGPGGTESLYAFQGLVNNHVYALGADGDRLLAGTLGGLSMLEGGAVRRNLTAANSGLKHNWITAIAATSRGWLVGTYGAGVEQLDREGRFSAIELPAGAPRDLVINPNALLVTRSHTYAGTLGHGLLVLDEASGRWSRVTRGLPSLNVTAFAEREGELYVGTENGLVRIAEARLTAGGLQ